MLIVHAVSAGDLPLLWVEGPSRAPQHDGDAASTGEPASEAPSNGRQAAGSNPAEAVRTREEVRARHARVRRRADKTHGGTALAPYSVDPERLAGRLSGFDDVAPEHRMLVDLWLPARDGRVLPSSPLVDDIVEIVARGSGITLAPVRVWAVRPGFADLHELLMRSLSERVFEPGVMAGRDLAWFAEVLWLATTLVARERFVPGLTRSGDRAMARWEPVIIGDDAERVEQLADVMPRACCAVSDTSSASPPATVFVSSVAGAFVDRLVRAIDVGAHLSPVAMRSVADSVVRTGRSRPAASVHDRWVAALLAADGVFEASRAEATDLQERLTEWKRSLDTVSRAPFVLCFRLEEPPVAEIAETAEAATAEGEAPWTVNYLLQAIDDPSLLIPVADIWRSAGRTRIATRGGFDPRAHVLQSLGQAASIDPGVDASLRSPEPAGYPLDVNGAYEFLRERAWALRNAGFRVILPAWWTRRGRRPGLTARAKVRSPRLTAGAQLSLDQLLSVEWEVLLGDTRISRRELEALARLKTPLVRVRGQWVEISAEDRQHALRLLQRAQTTASARSLLQIALGANTTAAAGIEVSQVDAAGWLGDLLERLGSDEAFQEIEQPGAFDGELRPYQRRGYSWLSFLGGWGLGACLADDMGLGKTVQALAFLQWRVEQGGSGPVLLVCPTSVVGNWQREAARFVPGLGVMVHHGTRRPRGDVFARQASQHSMVLSSYALLHRDAETLRQVQWAGVILDEAQNIKNPDTSQARAARSLPASFRVALTGTPIENTVGDLWSLMEFLNPGLLGSMAEFKRRFFVPIQVNRDPGAAAALKRITGPFVLRRLKTDRAVAADLPDKLEMDVFCTLTREQATLYAAVVRDAAAALEKSDGIQRKGVVLATLSKLKQVCNHPAQFLGDGSRIAGRSGKLARLTEMLEEVLSASERALVFTQFAHMGALIKAHVQDTFGREVLFLHGGTPKALRDRMVERFQGDADAPPVFVLSLKAGGTGLNLTAARHVFLFDRWWNPAVEAQAIDRVHRIGQTRDVEIHKFLCVGTVEEQINTILESKKDLASRVIGTGEGWLTELSTSELKKLFELRKEAVAD